MLSYLVHLVHNLSIWRLILDQFETSSWGVPALKIEIEPVGRLWPSNTKYWILNSHWTAAKECRVIENIKFALCSFLPDSFGLTTISFFVADFDFKVCSTSSIFVLFICLRWDCYHINNWNERKVISYKNVIILAPFMQKTRSCSTGASGLHFQCRSQPLTDGVNSKLQHSMSWSQWAAQSSMLSTEKIGLMPLAATSPGLKK